MPSFCGAILTVQATTLVCLIQSVVLKLYIGELH